jgi:predicted Zn-dependent protease
VETLAERCDRAQLFFDAGDFITASRLLAELVIEVPNEVSTRLLLARAYYHSAQLGRAEAELRTILQQDPAEAYAHLLLGRTLQRQSRHTEAAPHLRLASAMRGEQVPEADD